MKILFLTGNRGKFETAKKALGIFDIEIEINQEKIDFPEIQDTDISKVARFSAEYGANLIGKPVFVTDSGLYIKSLNGFPGALLKFMNQWFSPGDIINLLDNKKDRTAIVSDCLAYCEPGGQPTVFKSEIICSVSKKPAGIGSTMDQIIIWPDINKTRGMMTDNEMTEYWIKNNSIYNDFGKYLRKIKIIN